MAPDDVQDLVAGENAASLSGEQLENLEFGRRQLDRLPLDGRLVADGINDQEPPDFDRPPGLGRLAAPQVGLDPGDQLPGRERLGHVIIGAQLEAEDLVRFLGAGRQDQDGDGGQPILAAKPFGDLETVRVRKHQVQDDQVGHGPLQKAKKGLGRGETLDFEPGGFELEPDQIDDVGLVVQDGDDSRFHGGLRLHNYVWIARKVKSYNEGMKTVLAVLVFASWALGASLLPEKNLIKIGSAEIAVLYVGHASLILEFQGKVIHVDPVGREGDYAALPKADLILVSHEHFDHFDPAAIALIAKPGTDIILTEACREKLGKGTILRNGERTTVQGIPVEAVPAYNIVGMRSPGVPFHPRGRGNGYILTLGEVRVYLAGDSEATSEMKALKTIDVAFLPVMTPYTMSPEMAAEAVRAFRPRIVYPYHSTDEFLARALPLLKDVPGVDIRLLKK